MDVAEATRIAGSRPFVEDGLEAQRASLVMLKNVEIGAQPFLPLGREPVRLYVENVDKEVARRYATVVDNISDATVALVRLQAPYGPPRGDTMLDAFFHQGDLDFQAGDLVALQALMIELPTIVDIYLDRPAVIPELAESAAALMANFGASDEVILDAVFGEYSPSARLPFELPSSMEAVRAQYEDVPYDSEAPLFSYGFGLGYGDTMLDSLESDSLVVSDSLAMSDSLLQVLGADSLSNSLVEPNADQ